MGSLRALCDADNALLLVLDVQGTLFETIFNRASLRVRLDALLRLADLFSVPVVLTEQYPQGLGATITALRGCYEALRTDKHLLAKTAFGCGAEPVVRERIAQLADALRARRGDGRRVCGVDIIVAGIETHICVQQTVLSLVPERGYRLVVLQDCVGSREEANHLIALDRFRQCGAVLQSLESLAFEWTRDKNNPRFRKVSALVKDLSQQLHALRSA